MNNQTYSFVINVYSRDTVSNDNLNCSISDTFGELAGKITTVVINVSTAQQIGRYQITVSVNLTEVEVIRKAYSLSISINDLLINYNTVTINRTLSIEMPYLENNFKNVAYKLEYEHSEPPSNIIYLNYLVNNSYIGDIRELALTNYNPATDIVKMKYSVLNFFTGLTTAYEKELYVFDGNVVKPFLFMNTGRDNYDATELLELTGPWFYSSSVPNVQIFVERNGTKVYESNTVESFTVAKKVSAIASDGLISGATIDVVNASGANVVSGGQYATTNDAGDVIGGVGMIDWINKVIITGGVPEDLFIKLTGGTDIATLKPNAIEYYIPYFMAIVENSYALTNITTYISYAMMYGVLTLENAKTRANILFGVSVQNLATYDPLKSLNDGTDVNGYVYKRVLYFGNLIEILLKANIGKSLTEIVTEIITKSESSSITSFNTDTYITEVTNTLTQSANLNFGVNINTFYGLIESTTGTNGNELALNLTKINTLKSSDPSIFNVSYEVLASSYTDLVNAAEVGTIAPPVITGVIDNNIITIDTEKTGVLHRFIYTSENDESSSVVIKASVGYTSSAVFEIVNSTYNSSSGIGEFDLNLKTDWLVALRNGSILPVNRIVDIQVGVTEYSFTLKVNQVNRAPTSRNIDGCLITLSEEYLPGAERNLSIDNWFEDLDVDILFWRIYKDDVLIKEPGRSLNLNFTDKSTLEAILGQSTSIDMVDTFTCVLKAYDGELESLNGYVLTVTMIEPAPTTLDVESAVPVLPPAVGGKITIPAPTIPNILTLGSEQEKNANRTAFISKMFKDNNTLIDSSSKLVMSATALGVDSSIVTKENVRVLLGNTTNTEYPSGVTSF